MVGTFLGVWMHTSTRNSLSGFILWMVLLLYGTNFLATGLYIVVMKGVIVPVITTATITIIANDLSSRTCIFY